MKKISIINGPNLNLLGQREPEIYGKESFEDYLLVMRERFRSVNISFFQSNIEGELIDRIQVDSMQTQGIIINPGGYAHTSVAIRDAIAAVECPVIEVHISNIYGREEFRKNCITAGACVGVISGLGLRGYAAALEFLIQS
jgi:3-dehydroquinate dehydratase-2